MKRSRLLGWIMGGLAALLVVVFLAAILVLRSRRFHEYVRSQIIHRIEQATSARVEIEDYSFDWSRLGANIRKMTVHGTEPPSAAPLFTADNIWIGFKVISALQRRIALSDLTLDHAAVNLLVDKNGNSNIPHPNGAGPSADVFQLAAKHFAIRQGQIAYNDRVFPLAANVRDLTADAGYELLNQSYHGYLHYADGTIQVHDFAPIAHRLEAAFMATRDGIRVDQLHVATASSDITLEGNLTNYSDPSAQGAFSAEMDVEEAGRILSPPSSASGRIKTAGTWRYHRSANNSFIKDVWVEGNLQSPQLRVTTASLRADVRNLRTNYRLADAALIATSLQADLLDGHLTGQLTVRNLADLPESHFAGKMNGASVNAASNVLVSQPLRDLPIRGNFSATFDATWRGTGQAMLLRSDVTFQGQTGASRASPAAASRADAAPNTTLPLDGVVHLRYDGPRGMLSFTQSYLRTPHSEVQVDGAAARQSSLNVRASSDDLHELDLIALSVRRAAASRKAGTARPEPLGLRGAGSLTGQVSGDPQNLHFVGDLALANAGWKQAGVRQLRGKVEWGPEHFALRSGLLETAARSQIRFQTSATLRDWSYDEALPLELQASTSGIPAAELQRFLNTDYPVSGVLSGSLNLDGSALHPKGGGALQLTRAVLWGQPVDRLSADVQAKQDTVDAKVMIASPAGNASGKLAYDLRSRQFDSQLDAPGVQLAQMEAIRRHQLDVAGVLSISGSGRGSLDDPVVDLAANVPTLQFRGQTLTQVKAQFRIRQKHAHLAVSSKMTNANLQADGNISLAGDYYAEAQLDAGNLPLALLAGSYLPDGNRDYIDVHASMKGPLRNPAAIEGQINIPTLKASYQSLQVQNNGPIVMQYRNDVLTVQHAEISGTGTNLRLQGSIPLRGPSPVALAANGTADLRLIKILRPQADAAGQIELQLQATGPRTNPEVEGRIRLTNGLYEAPDAPLGVERLNGELSIHDHHIDIVRLAGETGGGTLTATGSVVTAPEMRFDVGISANAVRLRYPHGLRTVMQSELTLTGSGQQAALTGRVLIDRISFTEDFDLAEFVDQFRSETSSEGVGGLSDHIQLDVAVQTADSLNLESSKLSVQGGANLRVRGTATEPVLVGRATLNGGELFFGNNRYEVENGVIDFANPLRTEPVLNLALTVTVQQYLLHLTLVGPLDRLRTTYSSEPPLPPVDVINLLAFGRTTEAAGGATSLGAEALLAKGLSSQVSGQLERLIGISRLSIDPSIGGNQQNPGARVAIQQRLTSKILITFATDLTSTQGEDIQIQYKVSRGWSVTGTRDQNGGYAVDVKRHKTF